MTSPLSSIVKKQRPVIMRPEVERKIRGVNSKEGFPLLPPQVAAQVAEEMSLHPTTDILPTFHYIPLGDLMMIIDNGREAVRIQMILTKSEFIHFSAIHQQHITNYMVH